VIVVDHLPMNSEMIQKIQTKWGKFTTRELKAVKDDLDCLVAMIQATYGCSRSRAELELHDFRRSLRPGHAQTLRGRPY
jgi:hypothetical protein